MPYVVPTIQMFLTKFPEFEDTDGGRVQLYLDEAAGNIDKRWLENDYQPAIMYLAAHLIATSGSGEAGDILVGSAGDGVVASESYGPISLSYASGRGGRGAASSSVESLYGTTEYGVRFLSLLRRNFPPIVAI